MHMPMFGDTEMGRSGAPGVNVVHPEKSRRIDAMDEVKRALETAEEMPLRYLILHLGQREDMWSPRTVEHAMTAIEHLQAFARPLGVKLLLENIENEVTESLHLVEIIRIGHFKDVGVCLDVGHAHIGGGIAAAVAELKPLIRSTHLHDNHGQKDEHLWPGDGTIAWTETMQELRTAPELSAAVLEINYLPEETPEHVASPGCGDLQEARAVGGNDRCESERSGGCSSGHDCNPEPARRKSGHAAGMALQHARKREASVSHLSRRDRDSAGHRAQGRSDAGSV